MVLDIKDHITQLIVQDAHSLTCQHMGTESATDFRNHWSFKILKITQPDLFHMLEMGNSEFYTNEVCLQHFQFADAEKQYPFINVGVNFLDPSTFRIILVSLKTVNLFFYLLSNPCSAQGSLQ